MPRSRGGVRLAWAAWIGLFAVSSGANCYPSLVCQLPPNPTLADVLAAVDGNANLVQSLLATRARISGRAQGRFIPNLHAQIALEKPRRFRLIADMPLAGGEAADLGSNDEEFWFWLAQNDPPNLFYIRHEDYARAVGRLPLPFDPYWIIEALGVSPLGDELTFTGPAESDASRLELRTTRVSPQGEPVTKIIRVDNCTGWIREQYLYDAHGELVASAVTSGHQRDPSYGAVVPRRVQLEWPKQQLSLDIRLGDVQINEDLSASQALWERPVRPGVPEVNLFAAVQPAVHSTVAPRPSRSPVLDGIEPVLPERVPSLPKASLRLPPPLQ